MTKINKKLDGTVKIPVTVAKAKIKQSYQKLLADYTKKAEIKGFRKGKAPQNKVEKSIDQSKLYQQVLESLLPGIISKATKEHNLKPISRPLIQPISMQKDQDWQFTLELIEFPTFELGNYKDLIKGALKSTKIWLPGEDDKNKKQDQQSLTDKRLKKVFDTLLDNIEVPISKTLIEEEVNRNLSRLLNQVQKLGLTIEKYLSSINKTSKSIRKEYQKTATANLKLELILQKISLDLGIKVEDSEIQKLIDAIPDEKTKKSYKKPQQKTYLSQVIKKRKTIDTLLKMA